MLSPVGGYGICRWPLSNSTSVDNQQLTLNWIHCIHSNLIYFLRETRLLWSKARDELTRALVYSLYNPGEYASGVNHWENSQSTGNSTRNKVAIPAMVTRGGVNHWENSQTAGNLMKRIMDITPLWVKCCLCKSSFDDFLAKSDFSQFERFWEAPPLRLNVLGGK